MHFKSHLQSAAEPNIFLDGLPTEGAVPPPFTTANLQSALNELPEGARLAVQTCLDVWRKKVMIAQLSTFSASLNDRYHTFSVLIYRNLEHKSSFLSSNATLHKVELSRQYFMKIYRMIIFAIQWKEVMHSPARVQVP